MEPEDQDQSDSATAAQDAAPTEFEAPQPSQEEREEGAVSTAPEQPEPSTAAQDVVDDVHEQVRESGAIAAELQDAPSAESLEAD